jgi:hypothetical protein
MKSLRLQVLFVALGLAAALAPAFMLVPQVISPKATILVATNNPWPPPPPG